MDKKLKGGDEVGDVVGEKNEGGEVRLTNGSFCHLCSTEVKDFKIHIETNHARKAGDGVGNIKAGDCVGKHIIEVELEDEFGCKICGKISHNKSNHIEHLNEEHSTGAILIAADVVNQNTNRIDQTNKYVCEKCHQSFIHILTLQAHHKNFHGDEASYHFGMTNSVEADLESKFRCEKCNQSFSFISTLRAHF